MSSDLQLILLLSARPVLDYKKEKSISLSLGGIDIAQLCNEARSAVCVVKVRASFDYSSCSHIITIEGTTVFHSLTFIH